MSSEQRTAERISVVVCVLNDEKRIEDCLKSIILNEPDEIIVVDGGSKDQTAVIARKYAHQVIISSNSNLTRDRQKGIDAARNEIIAMIDSDHRLEKGDLRSLLADLQHYGFAMVQSQLLSFKNNNYWNAAEESSWRLTHNFPGPKKMIGVAPAIFRKSIFQRVKFDDTITKTIDDTDFIYRLSRIPDITFGIGRTKIKQLHSGTFQSYFKKFRWYGYGDGEFCLKHPRRSLSMLFHLLIRYPVLYPLKALRKGEWLAVPYFIFQGCIRFYGMSRRIISLMTEGSNA